MCIWGFGGCAAPNIRNREKWTRAEIVRAVGEVAAFILILAGLVALYRLP